MTIEFKPTWLYIKQHNVTGLKYFGKTIKNPDTYNGSGVRWVRHLTKHGTDVSTIWKQLFTDKTELNHFALKFSQDNNIVESNKYANLKPEDGLMGGDTGISKEGRKVLSEKAKLFKHTAESKQKIREARAQQKPTMLGKTHSEKTKQKIREYNLNKPRTTPFAKIKKSTLRNHRGELNPMFGKKHSSISKEKISLSLKGRTISEEWRIRAATARIGSIWWHNNISETRSKTTPGINWLRGRLPKTKEN